MDSFYTVEVHYDRTVLSLLLTGDEVSRVTEAVRCGEATNVTSRNWINKSEEVGTYTINGRQVNYVLVKPDVPSPW